MAFLFLDSSAVAKRYLTEPGSAWIASQTDPGSGNVCWLASVAVVEMAAAIHRRIRMGTLTTAEAQFAESRVLSEFQHQFRRFPLYPRVITGAINLVRKYPLRAYDAIQLATALELNSQRAGLSLGVVTFVSADKVQNAAAESEGLLVDDPNRHP